MNADDFVGGHSILALERFMDETRHMIIFDVPVSYTHLTLPTKA